MSSAHIQFRSTRMLNDTDFTEFRSVFTQSAPHTIWKAPSNYNDIAVCKFICKLYVFPDIDSEPHICPLCNAVVYNIFRHASCSCQSTLQIREQYWSDIANMDIHLCAELSGLQNEDLFLVLLGRHTNTPTDVHYFRMMNFRFVRNSATIYNRALQLHALPV